MFYLRRAVLLQIKRGGVEGGWRRREEKRRGKGKQEGEGGGGEGEGKGKRKRKPGSPIGVHFHLKSVYFLLRSQLSRFLQRPNIKMRFYKTHFIQNSYTKKKKPPTDSAAGLACYFKNHIHQICQE